MFGFALVRVMISFKDAFIGGLKITVPILVTVAIVVWLLETIEVFFGLIIKFIVPAKYYIPGMGLLFGMVLIMAVGFVMYASLANKVYNYFEGLIKRIPGVKLIYGTIQDVMGFMDQSSAREHGSTVLVEIIGSIRVLGFITREDLNDLHLPEKGKICVYCPMSYQIGGYTLFVSKDQIQPIDINTQEAMSFILTAGIAKQKETER